MAFDVGVSTQDVTGIVLFTELGPDFLINACASLSPRHFVAIKNRLLFLSSSHCNTGYLTLKFIQSEAPGLRPKESQRSSLANPRRHFLRMYAARHELKGKGYRQNVSVS